MGCLCLFMIPNTNAIAYCLFWSSFRLDVYSSRRPAELLTFPYLKGVKKVGSAIKLCSYYISCNVSNDIKVTGIL